MNLKRDADPLDGRRHFSKVSEVLDFVDWQDSDWPDGLDAHPDLLAYLEGIEDDAKH